MRSLTEKLQAKELAIDQLPPATAIMRIELGGACDDSSGKGEDLISYGSGGSALVGGESPQVLDSGDSHYSNDVGSNDGGHGYFGTFFDAGDEHHDHEQEQPFGWWVWS